MEEGGTQGLEEYQNTPLPGIDTKDASCCLSSTASYNHSCALHYEINCHMRNPVSVKYPLIFTNKDGACIS